MRLKIFILSTMLITLISGVLFYKNLTQIDSGRNVLRFDFDELRSIDSQVANTAFYLRKNLNADNTELLNEMSRIKELLELINDINRSTPELLSSVQKIRTHFEGRLKDLKRFEKAEGELRENVAALLPMYNELEKKNIKYTLDKRDFYRECILDAYMFISFSHKENEMRLSEDQKILSQIINFATTPSPELQKFAGHLEVIQKKVKEIDEILRGLKEQTIASEMKIIEKYYMENIEAQNQQTENILKFTIAAIGIYMLFMVFILRKS